LERDQFDDAREMVPARRCTPCHDLPRSRRRRATGRGTAHGPARVRWVYRVAARVGDRTGAGLGGPGLVRDVVVGDRWQRRGRCPLFGCRRGGPPSLCALLPGRLLLRDERDGREPMLFHSRILALAIPIERELVLEVRPRLGELGFGAPRDRGELVEIVWKPTLEP